LNELLDRKAAILETTMEVTLEPKTRNGKNRLARVVIALPAWDGTWRVVRSCDRVTFALHRDGPWHLLEPVADAPFLERFWRWVSATDDENFILRSNT